MVNYLRVEGLKNGRTEEWISVEEGKDERMKGWKDGWKDERMKRWKDEMVKGWKDKRMKRWKDERIEG